MDVGRIRRERRGGEHVVVAEVDGAPVWFSSPDAELAPSPEAFGSALLLAALDRGEPLRLAGRADRLWRENAARAAQVVAGWWEYPALAPQARSPLPGRRRAPRGASALCFTGGADSFHSLLEGLGDTLVYVLGYDVALDDVPRAAAVERLVRAVAAESGRDAVILRTNLREHPSFGVNWERAHGGALAAAGHLLRDRIGELVISATFSAPELRAWGSHPELDRLWSSSRVRVRHAGEEIRRILKLPRVAAQPLVQRHLRVCWEHRTADLNCSRCDKCLIAMVVLAHAGLLRDVRTLDDPEVIAERLDALHHTRYLNSYGTLLDAGVEPDVHAAIARLLERTMDTTGVMMP
jgi:hypothetical protein